MAQLLTWDVATKKLYETGVDHGVLYPIDTNDGDYPLGVAWNGLVTVTEKPSGAEPSAQYADNIKYVNVLSAEQFGATIEAFTYPEEFGECDGTKEATAGLYLGQQGRKAFGLSYRTVIGNDAQGNSYGYKLHLVYGCLASPSEKAYSTINDSPEAITFSWEVATTPVPTSGYSPVSSIVIDSTSTSGSSNLAMLEGILYGSSGSGVGAEVDARLPLPLEVISIITSGSPLQ
jgi:hypothetical protein